MGLESNNGWLNEIALLIRASTGIVLEDTQMKELDNVMQKRLDSHDLSVQEYINMLRKDYQEVVRLASDFTIQETSFYRNRDHFNALKNHLLPELIQKKRNENNKKMRFLSAGCATGEEPYTLVMILLEILPDYDEWDIEVVAVDICLDAITYAKEGEYSLYKMRNIDPYYVQKYFSEVTRSKLKRFQIDTAIKDRVGFRHCNLLSSPFELKDLGVCDIILCENVIIYFDKLSVSRLMGELYDLLAEDGALFLGYSETLNMITHSFQVRWQGHAYYYHKIDKIKVDGVVHESVCPKMQADLDYSALYNAAVNCYENKQFEKLVGLITTYQYNKANSKGYAEDERFVLLAGEYFLDRKDNFNALGMCQQSMAMNPFSLSGHLLAGSVYLQLEMYEQAQFEFDTAISIDKGSTLAHFLRFQSLEKQGDEQDANRSLETALSLYWENNKVKTCCFPHNSERENRYREAINSAAEVVGG